MWHSETLSDTIIFNRCHIWIFSHCVNWDFVTCQWFHVLCFVSFHFRFRQPEVDSEPWFNPSSPSSWPSAPGSTTSGSWASSVPSLSRLSSLGPSSKPRSCPARTTWRGRRSPSQPRFEFFYIWMEFRLWMITNIFCWFVVVETIMVFWYIDGDNCGHILHYLDGCGNSLLLNKLS